VNQAHIDWSRNLFETIRDGGAWGIPRSGLIFTKRGRTFELTARMPHDPAMPITVDELREQQDHEFGEVAKHFRAAGIAVVDKTGGDA
jgi:predicted transcriptional regulator